MVENIGINRVPTNEEASDYNQVGAVSPKTVFLRRLAEVEMTFVRKHLPFDGQCAKLEFKDRIESIQKESERQFGYVRQSDIARMKFEDLDKYGDMSRFDLLEDNEEIEMQNVNNTRTSVVIGHTLKYVCKERGHGISVFIPISLYNERFGAKELVDDVDAVGEVAPKGKGK